MAAKRKVVRVVVLAGGLAFSAAVCSLLALYLAFFYGTPTPQIPFDPDVWKSAPPDNTRYRMYEDLFEQRLLHGRSRAEVVELLGPPTETSHFAEWELVYWMGPEPGLIQVDSVWLVIDLEDDQVTAFEVVTD